MKINTDRIPQGGLAVSDCLDPSSLDLETDAIKFKLPIKVAAQVAKENNAVQVKGIISVQMELTCSRCLTEFPCEISKKFRFIFRVEKREILNLSEEIRQEIILTYPLKPLCREDCRGLCFLCGQNLNERECECNAG